MKLKRMDVATVQPATPSVVGVSARGDVSDHIYFTVTRGSARTSTLSRRLEQAIKDQLMSDEIESMWSW